MLFNFQSMNGFNFVRLDGSMTSKKRIAAIEAFSDANPGSPTIFLLSLKAGGVGLNLTAASRVFLLDPVSDQLSRLMLMLTLWLPNKFFCNCH